MIRLACRGGLSQRSTDIGEGSIVVESNAMLSLLHSQFRPEVIEIDGDRLILPAGTACADFCTQETTSSTARSDFAKWASTSI